MWLQHYITQSFMHKNTKLPSIVRKEICTLRENGQRVADLAVLFRVTKPVIYKIIKRGSLGDFSVHKSTNRRYNSVYYGLKRLNKKEKLINRKLAKKSQRYEKEYPGEMIHVDTKSIRRLPHEHSATCRSETLFVAIDDHSRYLIAQILPRKSKECAGNFLKTIIKKFPAPIECIYSDNGCEFKGNEYHEFVKGCRKNKIIQRFTRVQRPQTNGKAERMIRTLVEKWLKDNRFKSRNHRYISLQDFVFYYNNLKPHSALKEGKNLTTPCQRLEKFLN